MDVFVSYSHRDTEWKNRVCLYMQCLRLADPEHFDYQSWSDAEIDVGAAWEKRINDAIDRAKVAILLISPHFLTSRFILDKELPRILERNEAGRLVVSPVIIRPSPWQEIDWLSAIQLFPAGGSALSLKEPAEIEDELNKLCMEIVRLIKDSRDTDKPTATRTPPKAGLDRTSKGMTTSKASRTAPGRAADSGFAFMSEDMLAALVARETGATATEFLKIYEVPGKQQVWLGAGTDMVFCIIDSRETAQTNDFLRWTLPQVPPPKVTARDHPTLPYAGRLNVGKRQNWLYRKDFFATPEVAVEAVETMMARARNSAGAPAHVT